MRWNGIVGVDKEIFNSKASDLLLSDCCYLDLPCCYSMMFLGYILWSAFWRTKEKVRLSPSEVSLLDTWA